MTKLLTFQDPEQNDHGYMHERQLSIMYTNTGQPVFFHSTNQEQNDDVKSMA